MKNMINTKHVRKIILILTLYCAAAHASDHNLDLDDPLDYHYKNAKSSLEHVIDFVALGILMDITTRYIPKPFPIIHNSVETSLWGASFYSGIKFGYHTAKYLSLCYGRYTQGNNQ